MCIALGDIKHDVQKLLTGFLALELPVVGAADFARGWTTIGGTPPCFKVLTRGLDGELCTGTRAAGDGLILLGVGRGLNLGVACRAGLGVDVGVFASSRSSADERFAFGVSSLRVKGGA